MNITKKTFAILVGSVTTLALAGCSGAGSVYDFSPTATEPSSAITIKVPDDLVKVAGLSDGELVVTAYALRSRSLQSSEYCAYDMNISYAPGALELVSAPQYTEADARADVKSDSDELLANLGVSSFENGGKEYLQQSLSAATEEQEEQVLSWGGRAPKALVDATTEEYITEVLDYESVESYAVQRFRTSGAPYGSENPPQTLQEHFDEAEKFIEANHQKQVDDAAAVSKPERVASRLDMPFAGQPRAGLNEKDPQPGVYFDHDLKAATVVQPCAPSMYQSSTKEPLSFVVRHDGEWTTLAAADVAVMADGTIGVSGEAHDFIRDANGTWIKR